MMCGPGPVRRPLLAFVPVMAGLPNLAMPLEQHVGNAVSGYLLALPVNEPDPLKQLERIRRQTSAAKRARVAIFAGLLAVFTHAHAYARAHMPSYSVPLIHAHTCMHTYMPSYSVPLCSCYLALPSHGAFDCAPTSSLRVASHLSADPRMIR